MERERIAFNFKELLKSFFGNGEAYEKDALAHFEEVAESIKDGE